MSQRDEREKLADAMSAMKRNAHGRFVMAFEVKDRDLIVAALRAPADGEVHAEIQRLLDAKRRAMKIADERAKENVALREQAFKTAEILESDVIINHDYRSFLARQLRAALAPEPADTPDEGPDPFGYAKGERA